MSERMLDILTKIINNGLNDISESINGVENKLEEQNKYLASIAKSLQDIAPFKTEAPKTKRVKKK